MDDDLKALATKAWLSRPLCCRYVGATFESIPCQIAGEPTIAVWGLGLLGSGEREVLGIWVASGGEGSDLRCASRDLHVRGVTHISYVMLCNEKWAAGLRAPLLGATPLPFLCNLRRHTPTQVAPRDRSAIASALKAVVASDTSQEAESAVDALLTKTLKTKYPATADQWQRARSELEPFFALGTRLRRLIRNGEVDAELLHQRLVRSVSRHGAFADGEAALAFVGRALERAQHGFDAPGGSLGSLVAKTRTAESKVQRTRRQHSHPADPRR